MKNRFFAVLVPALSLLLVSCNQDEIREYDIFRGDETHMYAVDLGLSVKWACCNIGAEIPEEYGSYYAWGDPEEKDSCAWSVYKWHDNNINEITKYNDEDGKRVLDPSDDIAQIMWGEDWRMPTQAEIQELMECCEWEWTSVNGVYGYEVSGNGNSIFLPAAGYRSGTSLDTAAGCYGTFWSSTPYNGSNAKYFYFYSSRHYESVCNRSYGRTVRPVLE